MKIEYNITQNKFNTSLNQEVTEIKLQFQTGYYPIPVGLSNYYNKNEVDNLLDLKADVLLLDNYYTKNQTYTKDEVDNLFSNETLDTITDRGNSTENPITVGSVQSDFFQLDTTALNTYEVGKFYWNETKGTYDFGLKNNVTLQLGQEQNVYGKAYSAISNGQLVMYRTSQGGHILFEPANFTQLSTNPDLIIGVATQDIALNNFGYITTFGEVNTLNTSSFADGGTLYFGSGNVLQNTAPTGSYFIVGRVNRSHATQGSIFVKPYFVDGNLESKSNKSDSYTASSSTTYASTKALVYGLATKLDKGTYTGTASDLVPYNGATQNVNIGAHYFESSYGFKKTGGAANQYLMADGSTSTLPTDLIKGTGSTNSLVKFLPDGTAGDSSIFDSGTNVGIGLIPMFERLEIGGNVLASGFKKVGGTLHQALTANGGVYNLMTKADLVDGKVPSSQLPSYVDDVLEFANLASFPTTGESGKIYIAIDTNITYRWSGTGYAEISASLALGETASTAYRGDRGKIAYDHSQTIGNPHGTTKSDIGLGNVDNTSDLNKPISTATQNALNGKQNVLTNPITGTGANGQVAFFNGITTQTGDNGLFWDNTNKRLGIGTTTPSEKLDVNGYVKATGFKTPSGTSTQFLMADGSSDGNSRTFNFENAYAVGFSSGEIPNNSGSQYPYIYHNVGGYVALATQNYVINNYALKNTPIFNNKIVIRDNAIEDIGTNGTSSIAINYASYNSDFSQYRNLDIYDGKGNTVATFNGQNKSLNLVGNLTANSFTFLSDNIKTLPAIVGKFKTQTGGSNDFELIFDRSAAGTGAYYSIQSVEQGIAYNNLILQPHGGNVGIGTTSPSEKLEVNGNIKATSFFESSLRKYKTNIKKFDKSGIDLVDSLEIVTFDRIDSDVKSKIGIIADDTSDEFLSNDKCAVDLYKTVFIQAKAIQELKSEVDELKEELNNLRDLIMLNLNKV